MNINTEALAERVKDLSEENERLREREIPMKVDVTNKQPWCSNCNMIILDASNLISNKDYYKFCPHCGQRLDWSEELFKEEFKK